MTKHLLLTTAFLTILAAPAFATGAPTSITTETTVTTTAPADAAPPTVTYEAPAVDATTGVAVSSDPTAVPTLDTNVAPIDTATPTSADTTTTTTITTDPAAPSAEPVVETTTATEPPATEEAAAPAVEEKPAEPVVKKTPPAKLSALSKKYDLMSLDTDGNKSLSQDEFTAKGFSNAKTFGRFDADSNGRLTNAEINAYASTIEASISR